MSLESSVPVHDIYVQREVADVSSGTGAVKKKWKTVKKLRGRATKLAGETALIASQRGFKNPWVVLFIVDPGLTPTVNQLKYVTAAGVVHYLDVKSYRDEAEQGRLWGVECDELTAEQIKARQEV